MVRSLLIVENLTHHYGSRKALDDVSFTVAAGHFVALLGLNGAGKTTLYSLITRLYAAQTGQISVAGDDLRRSTSACLARMGVVFQARALDLDLSVRHNLRYHGALQGMSSRRIDERMAVELARAELTERSHDRVRKLSGGQARRVEIARALLHEPSLLLLDEPTVGLDAGARAAIIRHILELRDSTGLAVLWATHLIDEAMQADAVIILHHGRVVAHGSPTELMRKTATSSLEAAFHALTQAA